MMTPGRRATSSQCHLGFISDSGNHVKPSNKETASMKEILVTINVVILPVDCVTFSFILYTA